jgi:hypothetical protein
MQKIDYPKQEAEVRNPLFRWIILLVITLSAKVLTKIELATIYSMVGKDCGDSPEVTSFHNQIMSLKNYSTASTNNEKSEK